MQFVVAIRKVVKKEQSILHKEGLFERASFGVRTWRGGGGGGESGYKPNREQF